MHELLKQSTAAYLAALHLRIAGDDRVERHEFKGSASRAEYLLTNRQILFFLHDSMPVSIFEPTAQHLVSAQNCLSLTTLQIEREIIASGAHAGAYAYFIVLPTSSARCVRR